MIAKATVCLVVLFLTIPALVLIVASFSDATFIQFPPKTLGWRQYANFFSAPFWLGAIWTSLVVALATGLFATAVGLMAVFAMERTSMPAVEWLRAASISSLIIPVTAYALALYGLFIQLDLIGSTIGLILAHSVHAVALVVIILGAAIKRFPRDLEFVAMNLGASRLRAWLGITVRLLIPSIISAFIFAFVSSFDEVTLVNFLAGYDLITLPKAIFDSLQFGLDPLISAIGVLLLAVTLLIVFFATLLDRKDKA